MQQRIRRILTLLTLLLASQELLAEQFAFIVRFTDKNGTSFSLSTPEAYLSARAIARRTGQGISVDSSDLPVLQAYVDSVAMLTGGKIHGRSKWFNFCVVLVRDSADILAVTGKPYVAGAEYIAYYRDSLYRPAPVANNNAGEGAGKTSIDGSVFYGNTWNQTALVQGDLLYSAGYDGSGKLIAVMDGGFRYTDIHAGFSAMWSDGRMVDRYNFVKKTTDVFAYDDHGTKALSTMAGFVPDAYVGSAPKASYAVYVTEDGNSEQPIEMVNMLLAAERADSIGADVISASLGYNGFEAPMADLVFATDLDGKTTIAAKAMNRATSKGMLCVITAGNEGGNSWNRILTPGDADSALTVGSVNIGGAAAPSSGYGPNAAGVIKPDVCAMGQSASIFSYPGYGVQSGTSFSTPQIAGWAASLWQAYPTARPYQIKEAIVRCASLYNAPEAQKGYGIPNFGCAKSALLDVLGPPSRPQAITMTASPNPFSEKLMLQVTAEVDVEVSMQLIDVTGRAVWAGRQTVTKGAATPVEISVAGLATGVYMLKATTKHSTQVIRVVHN